MSKKTNAPVPLYEVALKYERARKHADEKINVLIAAVNAFMTLHENEKLRSSMSVDEVANVLRKPLEEVKEALYGRKA